MSKIFFVCLLLGILNYSLAGISVKVAPVDLKIDDKIECQVVNKAVPELLKKTLIYSSLGGDYSYLNGTSKTCFSFKVKTSNNVHIAMSSIPNNSPDMLEVVIGINGGKDSIIRKHVDQKHIVSKNTPNILNDKEYRGFWLHYNASGFLEVGKENETVPFLSYQHSAATVVNYIGFTAWKTYGNWLIDLVPKCPGTEQQVQSRHSENYEVECGKKKSRDEKSLDDFVTIQNNILDEMKKITNSTGITNILELEDIQNDLGELFKLSKMVHREIVIFPEELDKDVQADIKSKEESTFREIRKTFFNNYHRYI